MIKLKNVLLRIFRKCPETHVLVHDEDDYEFPKSYVVRNKKELECLRKSLDADAVKNIRQHRLFSGIVKGVFYLLVFYLLSDVLLDLLYRFHMLVHIHAPWDIPKLISEYFFNNKQGFPDHLR